MTGEGKTAGTGRLGKIKLTFQIFPPCAMSGPPITAPHYVSCLGDQQTHQGGCGRHRAGGLLGTAPSTC